MATRLHRPRHDSITDLVKAVRQHYTTPQVPIHDGKAVAVRTETRYYTSRSSDGGGRHVKLQDTLTRGHFSDPVRPYQTLGDVIDTPALFCSVLNASVPNKQQHLREGVEVDGAHQLGSRPPSPAVNRKATNTVKRDARFGEEPCGLGDAEPCMSRHEESSAGMADIREQLQEVEDRRSAVRTGQLYTKHVMQCQEARLAAASEMKGDSDGAMVLRPISSHHFSGPDNRKFTAAMDMHTLILKLKVKDTLKKSICKRSQKTRQLLERLNMIHVILTSLMNLKSKHLRTRTPLAADVVMALRKPVILQADGRHSHLKMRSVASQQTVIPSQDQVDLAHRSTISRLSRHSLLPAVSASNKAGPDIRGGFRLHRGTRRKRNSLARKDETLPKAETWEDFLTYGKPKITRLHPRRPWYPHFTAEKRQSTPYPKSNVALIRSEVVPGNPKEMVDRIRTSFDALKRSLTKQTKDRLSRYRRERSSVVEATVAALGELHPLWEHTGRKLNLFGGTNHHDGNLSKDQTPFWFNRLIEEMAESNASDTVMKELEDKLDKLRRFLVEEPSNVTNAKEKMCLLSVSLPVHELCDPLMRAAICFVLQHVLELDPDNLKTWLAYRHINLDA